MALTCDIARRPRAAFGGWPAAQQALVEGQRVVECFTPPLRTVVRPVRGDAPQVSDAPLAEAVFALEGDRIPCLLVAQRAPGRGVQRRSHLVAVVFASSSTSYFLFWR